MEYIPALFKFVTLIFTFLAITTGAQAVHYPLAFSKSFGISLTSTVILKSGTEQPSSSIDKTSYEAAISYVSLMGIRQFGTGLVLLVFAYQGKWIEAATVLAIIGFVVAGTDGLYLARRSGRGAGQFHAIPGALIAILALVYMYTHA